MTEPVPRYRCTACERAVLNGDFPRCLYCGADLPPEALLQAATTIAAVPLILEQPAQPLQEQRRSVLENLADAADIADVVVDGIDLIIRILE
jgi:hypothetical protein